MCRRSPEGVILIPACREKNLLFLLRTERKADPLKFTNQVQHFIKVLPWENAMTSLVFRNESRFTVCIQTVNLAARLPAPSAVALRPSAGSYSAIAKRRASGRAATIPSGLSNSPSADMRAAARTSWSGCPFFVNRFSTSSNWDGRPNRLPVGSPGNNHTRPSVTNQSTVIFTGAAGPSMALSIASCPGTNTAGADAAKTGAGQKQPYSTGPPSISALLASPAALIPATGRLI